MTQRLEFHPIAAPWSLLDGEQYQALRESVRDIGLLEPVLIFEGKIADGRNRYRACLDEEIDPHFKEWNGSEADLLEHLMAVNDARRHDPQEALRQRRQARIKRVAEARVNGQSLRTIAENEGIAETQVRRDLEVTTAPGGGAVEPERVTGRDGRTRTAKPKKPLDTIRAWAAEGKIGKRAAAELEALGKSAHARFIKLVNDGTSPADALKEMSREPGDDRPPPPPRKPPAPRTVLVDRAGNVVPDHLRDAFADPGLPTLIEELEQVEAMIRPDPWLARAGKLCDHYGFILIDKLRDHAFEALHEIQLALEALRAGVLHAVCPKCNGGESQNNGSVCKGCRGYGAVPQTRYQELSA